MQNNMHYYWLTAHLEPMIHFGNELRGSIAGLLYLFTAPLHLLLQAHILSCYFTMQFNIVGSNTVAII